MAQQLPVVARRRHGSGPRPSGAVHARCPRKHLGDAAARPLPLVLGAGPDGFRRCDTGRRCRIAQADRGRADSRGARGWVPTPDNSIYTVWTSPTEHHLVFVHPAHAERYAALHRRMDALATNLPDRAGSPSLAHRFNQASRWFPARRSCGSAGSALIALSSVGPAGRSPWCCRPSQGWSSS